MSDEYVVPEVLRQVRDARARMSTSELAGTFGPSKLYAMCEKEIGSAVARALYMHAMIEIGFIGETAEPDFKPYMICPVCGYRFSDE
jgi:hypothetical protein